MDERTRNFAIIGAAVLLVVGLIYFLASRTGPPEPTLGPGQTLHNPFGDVKPGGQGGARPGAASAAAPGGMPRVPAPGTVDPRVGFGPSAGGPFQKR